MLHLLPYILMRRGKFCPSFFSFLTFFWRGFNPFPTDVVFPVMVYRLPCVMRCPRFNYIQSNLLTMCTKAWPLIRSTAAAKAASDPSVWVVMLKYRSGLNRIFSTTSLCSIYLDDSILYWLLNLKCCESLTCYGRAILVKEQLAYPMYNRISGNCSI